MKLAFMSSVMPAADLPQLISAAKGYGYTGLEFRPEWKQKHGVELEASAAQRRACREQLAGSGVSACCLSPGSRFNSVEKTTRDAELEKLRRYIELASDLAIPSIRVFADPLPNLGRGARAQTYRIQAEYLAAAAEDAAKHDVRLVLETHGNCRALDVAEMLFHAGYPSALWINWHLLHCLNHGEDVDEAYRHVKGRVAHVHFALEEKRPDMADLIRQAQLLKDEAYDGFFSVEVINPAEADPILRQHAQAWACIKGA